MNYTIKENNGVEYRYYVNPGKSCLVHDIPAHIMGLGELRARFTVWPDWRPFRNIKEMRSRDRKYMINVYRGLMKDFNRGKATRNDVALINENIYSRWSQKGFDYIREKAAV